MNDEADGNAAPRRPRMLALGLGTAAAAAAADQLSKWAAMGLPEDEIRAVVPGLLDFAVSWNRGVSFNLGWQDSAIGAWALTAFAAAMIVGLVWLIVRASSPAVAVALGAILGGAAGNAIDRARFGAVFDFLHVHFGATSFFICNGADVFITLGVIGLAAVELFGRRAGA